MRPILTGSFRSEIVLVMQESVSSKVLWLWGSHHTVRSAQAFQEVFQITMLTP